MPLTRRSLLLSSVAAPLARAQPRKLSALVIDGINNHDWKAGTQVIRSVLESTGRFTVDVSTSPAKGAPAADWEAWRPRFQGHNVVVSNFNGGHLADGVRWPRPVEQEFETYVRRGQRT